MAVTASVQPKAPGSVVQTRPKAAAQVCCRMLTEGGKIHLQSELVPCFCFARFLSHPRTPSALTPLTDSGQAGCPVELLLEGALPQPSEGVARTAAAWPRVLLDLHPRTRQCCHGPEQGPAHTISLIPFASMGLGVAQEQEVTLVTMHVDESQQVGAAGSAGLSPRTKTPCTYR